MSERATSSKSADAYRTISEVAEDLGLPQHVLRFWETRFPQVKPLKRAGGRRFYRPDDVELLRAVKALLYDDGYTIKGVQRMLREQGPRSITATAALSLKAGRDRREDDTTPADDDVAQSIAHASIDPSRSFGLVASPDPRALAFDGQAPETGLSSASRLERAAARDVVGRLEAVLHDLIECERLIRHVRPF